jgi:sec-independent protein translocase protein TatB
MFELSFGKMMIIAVVALIVLGPEKLPKVARTLGHLLGRARSYANQVKQDIDREMQMDELRKLQQQAQDAARSFETAVNEAGRNVENVATNLQQEAASLQSSVNASVTKAESDATRAVENSIAAPVAGPTAHDEVQALEKSIAEQALESRPVISPDQMAATLQAPDPGKKAA